MQLGRWQRLEAAGLAGTAALSILFAELALANPAAALGAPPTGLALLIGLLIACEKRQTHVLAITGGGALGLVAASLLASQAVSAALLHMLVTIGAALVAVRCLGAGGPPADLFGSRNGLRRFAEAAVSAALLPGLAGAWQGGWRHGLDEFLASALFILLATPAIALVAHAALSTTSRSGGMDVKDIALRLLAGVGIAVLAFALPLPFLALGAVIVAALLWRMAGAAIMTAIVAVVAAVSPATAGTGFLAQQALFACCFGAGLPLALLLDRWRGDAARARQLSAVIDNNGDVLFLLDTQGRWAFLNPAWQSLAGQPVEQALGHSWLDRIAPDDREGLERQAMSVLAGERPLFRHTLRFQAPGGLRWVELCLKPVTDAQGRPAGAAGSLRDVDERKRLEEHTLTARRAAEQRAREATLLASTDELTGIANRRAFLHQLDREIEAAIDYGWPLAVALFDVDHFKAVNDRFGHAVGDRVLQNISARAVASVRGGDLVGRLGGEEFGILMPGSSAAEAAIVAERLRRAVQTASIDGQALPSVTVSIGIAQREDQRVAEALLAIADRALYLAKDEGRNRIRIAA